MRRRFKFVNQISQIFFLREETKYNRFEWCGRRRRRVSIYQSYYGREEAKYRSEWGRGKALAFQFIKASKTIGRGFAPRQSLSFSHVDVGDAFQFINHIMAEGRRNTAGR